MPEFLAKNMPEGELLTLNVSANHTCTCHSLGTILTCLLPVFHAVKLRGPWWSQRRRVCVSAFVSMKPLDIFEETWVQFTAVLLASKADVFEGKSAA